MPSIELHYDVNDSNLRSTFFQEILPKSIEALDKNMEPNWGKMSARHMIEHLIYAFQMSTDKLEVECKTPAQKRTKLQAFLHTNRPMPKGFISPVIGNELPELEYQSFNKAKEKLKKEIQYYLAYYEKNPDTEQTNPMFGKLGAEQWQKFHFKHCFHHLSQFSLVTQKN